METGKTDDFLSEIKLIAEPLDDLVKNGSGNSLIIIATDRDNGTIVINCSKQELVRAMVSFGLYEKTMDIYLESINEFSKVFDSCRNNNN